MYSNLFCLRGTHHLQNFDKNTILVYNFTRLCADIAQLVERTHGKGEVISSILIIGSPKLYNDITMSQDNLIKLQCTETGKIGYYTRKNKKKNTEKLELKKFNSDLRRHTLHREMKK